jgi:rubrerythrin
MADTFNVDEVFEIACQIERNGAEFYRRAAEFASDAAVKELLSSLSAMESEHEQRFAELRDELGSSREALALQESEEAALYLKAIAGGYVFKRGSDPAGELTGTESLEEILGTAIGLEKDSVVFYVGIKEAVPPHLGRDRVEAILKEEMIHVSMLSEQLKELRG